MHRIADAPGDAEPSALQIASRFLSGASRQAIKRLQRTAVPASKLACTSAANPQRRYRAKISLAYLAG
ncbi:MAG: hypothetical protein A2V87_09295 [Deltaproteobacteria bacterium RBG_16_58_17]|nr:MAG: hypothetical protein A2V87_09295 [Deltaproteobacteria bacterium RBG_16_58_17]